MITIDNLIFLLTLSAALGCGLTAGVFFAFSTFVMKALARLTPPAGIAAMQSINVAVLNPWFLGMFLGTAAACALVMIAAVLRWRAPGAVYALGGGALYLIGTLLVTMVCNVPRNNKLARITPTDPDSVRLWADYVADWTAWNHVRAAAALAAAAALIIAL